MSGTVHHIGAQPYVQEMCPTCGTLYLFPQAIKDAAVRVRDIQKKGDRSIYCPEGHAWHYTREAAEEKLQRDSNTNKKLKQDLLDLQGRLDASEALVRSLGGNITALPIRNSSK